MQMHSTWRSRISLFILTVALAACGGGCGSASPPPAAQSRTLVFASSSVIAYSGEALTNRATGQGTGSVTYGTGNSAVATVDSQGRITAVGVGTTNITASIAADAAYLGASASAAIEVIPRYISMSAWIGPDGSEVNLGDEANTMSLYRSTDRNCNLAAYLLCPSGQMNDISGAPIADTSATIAQPAFFTLQKGAKTATQVVNATRF